MASAFLENNMAKMVVKNLLGIILLLAQMQTAWAQSRDIDASINVDNRNRLYLLHLPPNFDKKDRFPVILAFHGGGGDYQKTVRHYGLNNLADANGFIVVYPNAINKAWNMPWVSSRVRKMDTSVDDVHFISSLLDKLISDYKVDSSRVFCTGISRGGIFSLFLAWKLSNHISAIAPVCASIPHSISDNYSFSHPTPVLLINGTEDPLINYNGGPGKMNTRNAALQTADMLATEELVSKIVKLDNCTASPIITAMPNLDTKDGCTATEYDYKNGRALVTFIKVSNGGHTWPGGFQYLPKVLIGKMCNDFSASEKIMEFFKKESTPK
jgi:polyhydroxybutyrate depolymerase